MNHTRYSTLSQTLFCFYFSPESFICQAHTVVNWFSPTHVPHSTGYDYPPWVTQKITSKVKHRLWKLRYQSTPLTYLAPAFLHLWKQQWTLPPAVDQIIEVPPQHTLPPTPFLNIWEPKQRSVSFLTAWYTWTWLGPEKEEQDPKTE